MGGAGAQTGNRYFSSRKISPGGSVSAGLAIYDTMQLIRCDVSTICMGMAASMAAVLLAGGTRGKRYALPNSEIMIHQPMGDYIGAYRAMEEAYKEGKKKVTSCCPAFVNMVRRHFPELADNISTTISPIAAVSRLI